VAGDLSDPSFEDRLAGAEGLTRSEAALARFYESSLPGAAMLNLEQVCAATGVSTATVGRFARALGYSGFRDMARSAQAELFTRLDHPVDRIPEEPTGSELVLVSRFDRARRDLDGTQASLDPAALEQAGSLLSDPDRSVYLAAIASGQPVMEHFSLLARHLRSGITMLPGQDQWAHALSGIRAGDVVMASAFDRAPAAIEGLLRLAEEQGAVRILVTNRTSPLVKHADVLLRVRTGREGVFRSRVPLLVTLECLLDLMAEKCPDPQHHAEVIERTFALLHEHLAAAEPPVRDDGAAPVPPSGV